MTTKLRTQCDNKIETVRIGDKTPFSMNQLHFEITAPENGEPMEFRYEYRVNY